MAHRRAAPRKGFIGIFNRSHYEDVLVVRVHNLVPKEEWESRYERINRFEKMLHEGGTTIVKVFLHISKDEQRRRLQSRLDDPKKRWKFSRADIARAALLGRLPTGVRGGDDPLQHGARAVVHRAGQSQVVPQSGDQPHPAEDAGEDGPAISPGRKGLKGLVVE